MAFVTAAGYALIEPDAPIVATTGRQPNDNYVRDLRENLQAVITMLDTMGIVDRNRLAIGGHSYGGFSTVNAMVHTPFFKAGIAGDGNYNRTLTPNGFQRERRDLWQGRETYLDMSPFLYADQLSGALLMYHSMEDQNVGTDPINSPKLFHALQGLGKTVSLYMYPYEDHGPIARETDARSVGALGRLARQVREESRIHTQGDQQLGSQRESYTVAGMEFNGRAVDKAALFLFSRARVQTSARNVIARARRSLPEIRRVGLRTAFKCERISRARPI